MIESVTHSYSIKAKRIPRYKNLVMSRSTHSRKEKLYKRNQLETNLAGFANHWPYHHHRIEAEECMTGKNIKIIYVALSGVLAALGSLIRKGK
jgi:hypothetical protein